MSEEQEQIDKLKQELATAQAQLQVERDRLATLWAQLTTLKAQRPGWQWEPVPWEEPLNEFGDYIHSGTLFVRCTTHPGTWHGYTFQEGEMLMRRVHPPGKTLAEIGQEMTSAVVAFSAGLAATGGPLRHALAQAAQTERNYVSVKELAQADEAKMRRLLDALERSPMSLEDVLRNLLSGWSFEDVMRALDPSIARKLAGIEENEEGDKG